MAINLSPTASKELARIMKHEGKAGWGLRMGVKGGGCSGLTYIMQFEEQPKDHDKINEIEGIRVFVDPKSYLYLNGMTLDYSNELLTGGFKFVNPNATQSCSCGTSFSA
jgi:iron-sulfur cluster assembly protein